MARPLDLVVEEMLDYIEQAGAYARDSFRVSRSTEKCTAKRAVSALQATYGGESR